MGRVQKYSQLSCAVNPECGREESLPLTQALQQKKILIVGGGPAGCEAARVLALRGYAPVLYEAGSRLGGSLLAGGVPDFKEDELALADWYAQELERLGVEVRLNRCAEPETIRAAGADVVIFATGGQDKLLPGLENNQMVCTAKDALLGNRTVGKRIVIAGSGTVACECALWLKARGKEVTIAARGAGILMHGQPSCSANSAMLKELIAYNGIPVRAFSQVTKAENGRVTLLTNGAEEQLAADTVVSAIGYLPNRALYDACSVPGCDSYVIGDASSVTNIMYAIWSAHEIARWI